MREESSSFRLRSVNIESATLVSQSDYSLDELHNYRQRYLGMTSYINDWFTRADNGDLTVNAGVLQNARQMWVYYKAIDRYSGIKRTYNYLYRLDDDGINEDIKEKPVKVKRYKGFKEMYGGLFH